MRLLAAARSLNTVIRFFFLFREELFLVMIMSFGAVISTIESICAGKMFYIVLKTKIGKLYLVLTN